MSQTDVWQGVTQAEKVAVFDILAADSDASREILATTLQTVRRDVGSSVADVLTAPETHEATRDRPLAFAEAAELLREHGIDLEKERKDNIRRQIRHGRISADQAAAYDAKFDTVQLSGLDVCEVIEALKVGRKFFTIFSTGEETPAKDFDSLITRAGIRTHEWARVSGFGNPNRAKKPSVTFTPADLNVPGSMTGPNADRRLEEAQETRTQYVEPAEWIQLFLRSVDNGLRALNPGIDIDRLSELEYRALRRSMLFDPRMDEYLLDVRTVTQFPGWRNSSGGVLGLDFHPGRGGRRVAADGYHPRDAYGTLGPRRSLGRFLPRGEAAKE